MKPIRWLLLLGSFWGASCATGPGDARSPAALTVGIVLLEGVYNTELVAPYDVFHHAGAHVDGGVEVFTVGRSAAAVTTYEGLVVHVDHDLRSAPPIDVLVVPSGVHSMGRDAEDRELTAWLAARGEAARFVMSVCDGAFVLAAAGLLDGHQCTTYPADIAELRQRHDQLEVLDGVSFVVDGRVITSIGGARSFEPALYLIDLLYGAEVTGGIAGGLLIDWPRPASEYHIVRPGSVGSPAASDRGSG